MVQRKRGRKGGGGASAAEGKSNRERLGFGVEFDPPVEVLFRHCDNSNNAGLTGTVHEGTKARAEGCRREAESSFRLFRNVETERPARLVITMSFSHSRSGVHARALMPGSSRTALIPSTSFRLSPFHANTATSCASKLTEGSHAFSRGPYDKTLQKYSVHVSESTKNLHERDKRQFYMSVSKRNFAA